MPPDLPAPEDIYELETSDGHQGITRDQAIRLVSEGRVFLKANIHTFAAMPGVDVDELVDEVVAEF